LQLVVFNEECLASHFPHLQQRRNLLGTAPPHRFGIGCKAREQEAHNVCTGGAGRAAHPTAPAASAAAGGAGGGRPRASAPSHTARPATATRSRLREGAGVRSCLRAYVCGPVCSYVFACLHACVGGGLKGGGHVIPATPPPPSYLPKLPTPTHPHLYPRTPPFPKEHARPPVKAECVSTCADRPTPGSYSLAVSWSGAQPTAGSAATRPATAWAHDGSGPSCAPNVRDCARWGGGGRGRPHACVYGAAASWSPP
jgi:hypothetical protein